MIKTATLEKFIQISKIAGVDQYILVDQKGNIAAHDIKNSERVARMILSCGQNSFAIGKTLLKYVVFSRQNQKNIFIFPVGNYYLGVVKQTNIDNFVLVNNIIKFLKNLLKTRS